VLIFLTVIQTFFYIGKSVTSGITVAELQSYKERQLMMKMLVIY